MLLKLTDGGDRITFNLLKVMNSAQIEDEVITLDVDKSAIEKALSSLSNENENGFYVEVDEDEILIYETHSQFQELKDWLA